MDARRRFDRTDYTFGAILLGGGTVRFRLWAPGIGAVSVELDGQVPVAMERTDNGYHQAVLACVPGSRYRYRVSQDLAIPDPASRLQDGDVHDASVVVDAQSYPWRHADWRGRPWNETVLYEIHCGLAGGFKGVERRLPELAKLGVTAVELMPIGDFPGLRNWGYDGVLPYAPDSSYGTPDELRHLIDTAHGLDMMVFLDVVYNHFGPDGNYLPAVAPEFFRSDIETPWGAAIDFRQQPVQAFFAENALYWLDEYRFDGLRLDAVHAIRDAGWLAELGRFVRARLAPDRLVHLVVENDDNAASLMQHGFDAQWNDDMHHVLHHMLTGESHSYYAAYADQPARKLARALAEGFIYQGEAFGAPGGRRRGESSAALAPTAFVFFLQNHDQTGNRAFGDRLVSLCGSDSAALHAAVALQLLTPHIPLLFMGEEVGAATPFQYFTSYDQPELAKAVREGRRTEFADFHDFSDPDRRARIPDPNDADTWRHSVVQEGGHDAQAGHWYDWYRSLLAIRQNWIVPHLTGARSDGARALAPRAVLASWILGNGDRLSIYCNLGPESCACPLPPAGPSVRALFHTSADAFESIRAGRLPAASTVATLQRGATGGAAA